MATAYYEKRAYNAIGFSPDGWDKGPPAADGSRTYTSTSDSASCEVKFESGTTQPHATMKTGSTVKVNKDGTVEITEMT